MNGQGLKIERLQLVEREEPADARLTHEERGMIQMALCIARRDALSMAFSMQNMDSQAHFEERADQYHAISVKVAKWGIRE